MPIYVFECQECEAVHEERLPLGETMKKCPSCGKLKLKQVITNPTYHDTKSPMHPRRGRGVGGYGRIDPG